MLSKLQIQSQIGGQNQDSVKAQELSVIEKRALVKIIIVIAAVILLALLYFLADARNSPIFPKCIFYALTGFYCPGCGAQRSFSALLHGQLWQALNYNILFIMCLPLLVYSAFIAVIKVCKKKKFVQHLLYSAFFMKILLVLIIAFWVTRNLPFYPFTLLAPHLAN